MTAADDYSNALSFCCTEGSDDQTKPVGCYAQLDGGSYKLIHIRAAALNDLFCALYEIFAEKYKDTYEVVALSEYDGDEEAVSFLRQGEEYCPFPINSLSNAPISNSAECYYSEDGSSLTGFLIVATRGNNRLAFYQKVYSYSINKRKGLHSFLRGQDTYDSVGGDGDSDLLVIENRVDCVIFNNTIFTMSPNILRDSESYQRYIKKEAQSRLDEVGDRLGLGDLFGNESVRAYIDRRPSSLSRLAGMKDMWLLTTEKDDSEIKSFVQGNTYYAPLLSDEGDLRIDSEADVKLLLDFLDDAYLGSDLSGNN